ncbi:MAG TPA: PspA/IM30 family protein [Candidatus Bathyarchaeia archaeon]|nr:PspA/IM30 family protein [Candidatus Bathyarchaeia archaeon]
MGIFKRLRDVTAASINDLIDSMEDPIVMLTQYMRDMEVEIGQVEVAVARQIAMEKRFRQQWEEALAITAKRERQVKLALSEGEDDLARRALIEQKRYEARAQEYEALYKQAAEAAAQMREKLAELKDEFYKMRAKKYALMSRAQVAQAQKQVNQAIVGFGSESASRGFARMEEKVLRMEAEAEVSGQWRTIHVPASTAIHDEIETELARIKASLTEKENVAN